MNPDDNDSNYVIRTSNLTAINKLYWSRTYYAKLRRNWSQGSKLVFLTKITDSDEAFIGLGKIQMTYELSQLDLNEKKICTENNCYSKIVFGMMTKFIPAVPIRKVQQAVCSIAIGPQLDGAHISDSEISKIEQLANIMIMK